VKLFKQFPDVLEIYQKRWSFILIDEYQDTNAAQYELMRLLSFRHHNVFAVGDPDQSIYSWRGADIQNILNFEKDFPGAKVVSLEHNYRSRNLILKAANSLIQHNASRYQKNLWSEREEGEKIALFIAEDEIQESSFVIEKLLQHHLNHLPLIECAIFYRTNFQSRVFEDALIKRKIPYQIIGGLSFYQRREIKDILALLRIVLHGNDYLSLSRTINLPKRGLGEATLLRLKELAEQKELSFFDACLGVAHNQLDFKISSTQRQGLADYVRTILLLREKYKEGIPLADLINEAISSSGYLNHLKEDPETEKERKENLDELVAKATESQEASLTSFLEELSLKSSLDETDRMQDAVRLMTLHHSKGLEFALVFLVGMEEELFPHANSFKDPLAIEEERRLCYVGMTRAKDYLYLSASQRRFLWGTFRTMRPSRFLEEIDSSFVNILGRSFSQEAQKELEFAPGEKVYHRDFGVGFVQKSYQTSLGLTYDVFFPQPSTVRTLVARYAKLIPVEETL